MSKINFFGFVIAFKINEKGDKIIFNKFFSNSFGFELFFESIERNLIK